MQSTIANDILKAIDDDQLAADEACERLAERIAVGEAVAVNTIKAAIQKAGWTPQRFTEYVETLKGRLRDEPLAAALPDRLAVQAKVRADGEAMKARHCDEQSAQDDRQESADNDVDESQSAESRQRRTKPNLISDAKQPLKRELNRAHKIIAKPLPATEQSSGIAWSQESRQARERRRDELLRQKAAAERTIARLQPALDRIRELELKAIPKRDELAAILATILSDHSRRFDDMDSEDDFEDDEE